MTQKRPFEWFDKDQQLQTVTAGVSVLREILDQMSDNDRVGATITRIIGTIQLRPLLANAEAHIFMGIALVNADAFSGGVVPDPEDAADQPGWLWKSYRNVMHDAINVHTPVGLVTFDIRSQRKLGREQRLLIILHNLSTSSTNVNLDYCTRTLVKHR